MTIHLYESEDFSKREVILHHADPNLKNVHFENKTSSIYVESGTWQVFDRPDYANGGAGSVILGPGRYPNPKAIGLPNDCISSVRPFSDLALARQRRPNLEKIFSDSDGELRIVSKFFSQDIGTCKYTTYSSDDVALKGNLDYDGFGQHIHGPFNFEVVINSPSSCTLTYKMGDINISHSFPIETHSEKDFDIIIDDYKVGKTTYNGRINVAHVIVGRGAKISPDIEVSPGGEHLTHGIIIKPS